jgi:L-asparagine transporter-like permease
VLTYSNRCRSLSVRCGDPKCPDTMYKLMEAILNCLVLPGFLNGCILIFVFSASNSDIYIASRTLYALALGGSAPSIIARTDRRGVPIVALAVSSTFCGLAYMNVVEASATVFKYLYNHAATTVAHTKALTLSPSSDCLPGSQSSCRILAS